ncbi:UDP-forming cellulose synthase catalytic subunit [Azospirillum doebereinerae]|uniref:Cellulose synthase catalytic subunit [UDP-forming] n=1 Tax=Azospirillum doebereinerae TaxID=92933 RepID=A0A3S0V4V1_9PROT|nr:UDP-forming cellulose synthase catalytic subunit [Azospirillum doebereinerae]RUQ67851.1 UDP-forming cellulose synthase catalytic subunit [Azospirillum doebereinerae]
MTSSPSAKTVVRPLNNKTPQAKRQPNPRSRRFSVRGVLLWVLLLLSAGLFLALAALPVGRVASVAISVAVVVAAFVLGRFAQKFWHARTLTVLLLAFVTFRYFFWRLTGTMPPVDDLVNFIPGVTLFAAEALSFVLFLTSLFVIIDPLSREPSEPTGDPAFWPTVDVYIPSYNEDAELLETTLAAAVSIDYPKDKLRVYLLDDGGTDQKTTQANPEAAASARERRTTLTALCERLHVTYMTRARNEHAKAGNINHAFTQTDGDLVLILDADHVPTVGILQATVGFFQKDSGLFLVQTPHFFVNPDPVEYNLGTFERMPSENEMFYYSIQPGLDRWNGAFFCGSAAVLRRAALEEVGGFAGETITEDCETALELHSRGWRSVYLPRPLIAGLQPETFDSFIVQRSRWTQGMIQLFLLKNPLFKRGLTVPQRLCYLSTMLYWFFWFWRPIFLLSPLCYSLFGLEIYRINLPDFACFVIPHVFAAAFLSQFLHGRMRWPLFSELYEYLQSFHVSRAALATIIRPRNPVFKVTAKGQSVDEDGFSPLATPFIVVTFLLALGLGACAWRYAIFPEHRAAILPVAVWTLLSFVLALGGLAVVYERKRVRRQERFTMERPAVLAFADGTTIDVTVADVSAGGVGMDVEGRWRDRLSQTENPVLTITATETESATTTGVRIHRLEMRGGTLSVGAGFAPRDRQDIVEMARFVFGNSVGWDDFLDRKRVRAPTFFGGLLFFVTQVLPRLGHVLLALPGAVFRILTFRAP